MKLTIAILLVIVLALVWQLNKEIVAGHQRQNQVQELTAKLAEKSTRDNLELQEKCALQAEKMFRTLGYKGVQQNGNFDLYRSHWNAKLNKCFMTIESTNVTTTSGTMFINRFLFDAYEQREYAEYTWMSSKVKKYWEVPPMICKLISSSDDEQLCKSEEEYKAFVARYME